MDANNMTAFIIGCVVGAIVMDFAWAYRLGLVRVVLDRIKAKFNKA